MDFDALVNKADLTAELGRASATYLKEILLRHPKKISNLAVVLQQRITLCNSPKNLWFIKDKKKSNGETFHAYGRYWRCNSIICSGCQQIRSRDKRRRLRNVLKQMKPRQGETYQFITLTVPNQNLTLFANHEFVDYAFSLFRKRKWFKERFRGSVKSFEFTKNKKGIHFHVHMLALSKYIDYSKLRVEWTECVQKSAKKFLGNELTVHTADQLLIVKVKKIYDLDSMVFELCKYITKGDSWTKVNELELLEYATAPLLPRLFEMLGCFRTADQEIRKAAQSVEANSAEREPIVHNKKLNDGVTHEVAETWRTIAETWPLHRAIDRLNREFETSIATRRGYLEQANPTRSIVSLPNFPEHAYINGKSHRSLLELYDLLDGFSTREFPPLGK